MPNVVADPGLTFQDFQKSLDPTGTKQMPAVNVLAQINAPLQDGPITPSNALLGNRIEIVTALPTTSLGQLNKGVPRSKGTTEQRNDSIAMFVSRGSVDSRQKNVWGEQMFAFKRAEQDRLAVESMSQFVASQFTYGSGAANSGGFDGLATRMAGLSSPAPGTSAAPQVWSKGTVAGGDGTSVFIADWHSERGVHWIYPMNSTTGGLNIDDKGENVPTLDADGTNSYFASVTEYNWSIGISVEDPRRIARLANIDTSDANLGGTATQGLIIDSLVDILSYMPSAMGFNRVMYVHGRILAAWDKQIQGKTAPLFITLDEYLGERVPHFRGIPVRRLDQITLSESTVS
jgi:major capsid protein gp7